MDGARKVTFHSLGARSIRTNFKVVGLNTSFDLTNRALSLEGSCVGTGPKGTPQMVPCGSLCSSFIRGFATACLSRKSRGGVPVFIGCKAGHSILSVPLEVHAGRRFSRLTTLRQTDRGRLSFHSFFR